MGHQLTFRATPADLAGLEAAFAKSHPYVCLAWRSPDATPKQLRGFSEYQPGRDDLKVLLVSPTDLSKVRSGYVPAQKYWTVDTLRSPVVEMSRCYVEGNAIRPGRLYYKDEYYGAEGQRMLQPEDFRKWAADLLKTTKNVFKRIKGEYVGAEAAGLAVLSAFR
jgi:hypothetical protein